MNMKKLLAFALVLTMCLSLFPVFAAADEGTPTITAYNASNVSQGTYSTIDAAATAAGEGGKIVLSAGTFSFNGRQTIAVDGITLEGAGKDQTKLYASAAFANASATNKKALLTITADGVTVKNLTLDGSPYGYSSGMTQSTDFAVLRANAGTGVTLNNIHVTGSKRTLINVGTSSTTASVTAYNLSCQGYYKKLPNGLDSTVYPDIDVKSGSSFTLENASQVNGFIGKDSGATFTNHTANHYSLTETVYWFFTYTTTSTVSHYVNSYVAAINDGASYAAELPDAINDGVNLTTVGNMVTEALGYTDATLLQHFVNLLTAARNASGDSSVVSIIDGYITSLNGRISQLGG